MVYICKSLNYLKDIKENDFKIILDKTNMVGYDYLYVYREAFCDEDKEDFFHTMIEVCAYSEIPVIVEFPITHFEDMKKLHYANVKLIIASEKTNVTDEVIEEGKTRFGKNLIVDKKTFDSKKINVGGVEMSVDQAMGLYLSTKVEANYNAINESGAVLHDTKYDRYVNLAEKGGAETLKAAVEKALPENYKKFADWKQ